MVFLGFRDFKSPWERRFHLKSSTRSSHLQEVGFLAYGCVRMVESCQWCLRYRNLRLMNINNFDEPAPLLPLGSLLLLALGKKPADSGGPTSYDVELPGTKVLRKNGGKRLVSSFVPVSLIALIRLLGSMRGCGNPG